MSKMNDEPYDLHKDEDENDETWSDHEIDSDIALDGFTDRAMRHGRCAATWLLVGALAELALFVGVFRVMALLHSVWWVLPAALITSVVMLMLAVMIGNRWTRHRTRMESLIEAAMVWRSDAQQKEQDEQDAVTQYYRKRADDDKRKALAAELTWNVGPAPTFIDSDGRRCPTPEEIERREAGLREFGELFDTLDDDQSDDAESDDVPVVPAVRAWMQRWAHVEPVKKPRPPRLAKRHSDAEGHRLERELCRAINKHWDGAFHKLLDEGADPNGFNGSGKPLCIAVLRGRIEYIGWLLALGADVNAQCHGRTIIATLMRQVEQYADEGGGEGDDYEWPERLELLARWGANPHIQNKWYDEDDDDEGPNAWPFIVKRPVLYEAYMNGHNAWEQAGRDALSLLDEARERAELEAFAGDVEMMLAQFRNVRPV
ncbi:hypothetical protein BTH42_00650 [Burkholderia sp. SRS-W-2-2016]|uniref:ankyrin repeat domain-containing protein n=1 Tax=Burkholderia sp. SRS-W-2-2016 TaxID=1926878 RepID=UPI00094B5502|nr:ankyrin repeat domain-containing protein [Burkholderia sp. SRS-W-2-2016]OLL33538.1 hypothetical protein BTH42_00650 [Burkholderia sp. SRS-W-2-2016]